MIQHMTQLNVADNSGAKKLKCIGVQGGNQKRYAKVGDIITCSVTKASTKGTVDKGDIVKAVIVRQNKEIRRDDGTYLRFDENAAVVLDDTEVEPEGTRVFGPIARELRDRDFNTILSLSPEVL